MTQSATLKVPLHCTLIPAVNQQHHLDRISPHREGRGTPPMVTFKFHRWSHYRLFHAPKE